MILSGRHEKSTSREDLPEAVERTVDYSSPNPATVEIVTGVEPTICASLLSVRKPLSEAEDQIRSTDHLSIRQTLRDMYPDGVNADGRERRDFAGVQRNRHF